MPYVSLTNGNTLDDIKNGLKGTLYSNFPIISVNYYAKDLTTGEEITLKEYPSHYANKSTTTGCSYSEINKASANSNSNFHSLYYNTSEDIQNELKNFISESDHYKVIVSVDAGTKENMVALSLNTDPEEDEEPTEDTPENWIPIINPQTGMKSIGIIIGLLIIISLCGNMKYMIKKDKNI